MKSKLCFTLLLLVSLAFTGLFLKSRSTPLPGHSPETTAIPATPPATDPATTTHITHEHPAPVTAPSGPVAKATAPEPATQASPSRQAQFTPAPQWPEAPEEPAFAAFQRWTTRYLESDANEHAAMIDEGVDLANKRWSAQFSLMQTDPRRAFELSLPAAIRDQLPPDIQAFIEEHLSGQGDLSVYCVYPEEGHDHEAVQIQRRFTLGQETYRTFVYGERLDHPTRKDIPVHGIRLPNGNDPILALSDSPIRSLNDSERQELTPAPQAIDPVDGQAIAGAANPFAVDVGGTLTWLADASHAPLLHHHLMTAASQPGGGSAGEVAESPYTEGRKRAIFFRVAFADVPTPQLTFQRGVELIESLDTYMRVNSFGRTSFAPEGEGSDVIIVTLTNNASFYDGNAGSLRNAVRSQARADGWDLDKYDFDVTATGSAPSFNWAGLGFVGAPGSWIRSGGNFSSGVTIHEIGHNLGLPHANFWDTDGESDIGPGGNQEYGDSFDVMGGGGSTSGHFNTKFKWRIGWIPDEDFPRLSSSGTYRLYAHDNGDSRGLRGIRIPHDPDTDLHLEFRQLISNPWFQNGLGVRWGSRTGSRSQLIDTNPGTDDGKSDSPIVMGRTWTDAEADVHVTPTRFGNTYPESLDVVVNFGPFPGNQPPDVVIRAGTTDTGTGSPVSFTATASDPDGDPLAYYWEFGDGEFGPNDSLATHSWSSAGEYVVRCTVSDMKGGRDSHTVLVRVGSPNDFKITGRVMMDGQGVPGVLVKATNSRYDYTSSDGTYSITRLGAGSYTVSATLYPFSFANPFFGNPVTVGPSDASNIDFLAVDVPVNDMTLLEENATWRYLDNGTDQGTAWIAPTFNDTAWPSGPAQLGYGDGDEATVVSFGPDEDNKYITTYFRTTFNLPDPAAVTNVFLQFHRDDGGLVYLNGVEVFRDNMPAGAILYTTTASGNSEDTGSADIPHNLLQAGVNTIAAEVHQVSGTSSDISFWASLTGTTVSNLAGLSLGYISAPLDKQQFVAPAALPIQVNAFSASASIASVEIYVDGGLVITDTLAPYSYLWTFPSLGAHTISAVVRDSNGDILPVPDVEIDIIESLPPPAQSVTLIPEGSTWKYLDNGSNQGANWRDPGFNDSTWASGPAQLGYGDGDEQTLVSFGGNSQAKHITTYFRRIFFVTDVSRIISLSGQLIRDDGGVVYLNGTEVFRSNMPGGTIDYLTTASGTTSSENSFRSFSADPSLLTAGANLIAVEIHQANQTSSDMSFDLSLDAQLAPPPPRGVVLNAPLDGAVLAADQPIQLSATATPETGQTITEVTFFAGASPIATVTSEPFTAEWTPSTVGDYAISSQATESGGQVLSSGTANISVVHPGHPGALISFGQRWRYLDTGVTPAPDWNSQGYDDSLWPAGSARLGYGGDGENTAVSFGTNPGRKHISTWFRHVFNVVDPSAFSALKLELVRDDAAVVYLNGTEVYRNNLLPGLVSPNSLAIDTIDAAGETEILEAMVDAALLSTGDNVVAVEVHQQSQASSDLGFDLALTGMADNGLAEGVYYTHPANGATFNMPASIELAAHAISSLGITSVEFLAGGSPVGTDATYPYAVTWANPPVGSHTLTLRASQSGGPDLLSIPIQITVGATPAPINPVQVQLLAQGALWRYDDSGDDLGQIWSDPLFNDALWRSGFARFGYGLDGETTTTTNNIVTTYFRQWFNAPTPELLDFLIIRLQRDDGAVVYLNGAEIFRNNMPQGQPLSQTLALSTIDSKDEQEFLEVILPTSGAGLTSGNNLVAVEIHQASLNSSDMGFDLSIDARGSTDRRVYLSSPAANAALELPVSIDLEAFAYGGENASIVSVEFFVDGQSLGSDTTAPYTAPWSEPDTGVYDLHVVATDDQGTMTTSETVTVSVGLNTTITQLIPARSNWKYLDDGSDQNTAWRQNGFNDVGWASGPAQLGYGDGDESTVVSFGPNSGSKYITTYFRHTFSVGEGVEYTNLTLRLQRDDGAVVYLNGTEVFRSNMPGGVIGHTTLAASSIGGDNEDLWVATEVAVNGLPPGPNVMAVEIHQQSGGSSDISFDLELIGTGIQGKVPEPSLTIESFSSTRVIIQWPSSALGYSLYSSVSLDPGASWTPVFFSPGVTNGNNFVVLPKFSPINFYRLQKP